MKIEFENGSVIEGIKSKGEVTRGNGWFIGIDIAKGEDQSIEVLYFKCPSCDNYIPINAIPCPICGE